MCIKSSNGIYFVLFAGLTFLFWVAVINVFDYLVDVYRSKLHANMIFHSSVVLAFLAAWLAVGYRITWLGSGFDAIFETYGKYISFLNTNQLIVIIIGTILVFCLFVFPPWFGYNYGSDEYGWNEITFIGFHFFASLQVNVLDTAPYLKAGPNSRVRNMLISSVLAICVVLFFLFRWKRVRIWHLVFLLTLIYIAVLFSWGIPMSKGEAI
jgi:hypothetical protein